MSWVLEPMAIDKTNTNIGINWLFWETILFWCAPCKSVDMMTTLCIYILPGDGVYACMVRMCVVIQGKLGVSICKLSTSLTCGNYDI